MNHIAPIQTPASRATDPETSREAERRMNQSGARLTQQERVFAALVAYPGSTSAELAHRINMDYHAVARRLPELEPLYIIKGEPRQCTQRRCLAVTWWPVTREAA